MTAEGKPLSQKQLDKIRPDHGDTLVIHQHSDSFNMGWLLVNGRYLSNQEVEHLEANREFLLKTHSEQVDLINELQAKLDLYGKSGCDLVVCNEPQRCGTVQELEAERDKQGELLNVVQTLLPTVCQDKDYMKNVTPKELAETLTEFYQPGRLPIVESALREAQKAMPCYSCLSKDWCEKTPGYICQFRPIKLALEGRSEYCTDSTVNGKEKTK